MSRYHKAAIDGNLDLLKEATKKDLNTPDDDGMTPTLWAAFHGHIDALQLMCSRGGDPDRSDIWGNTPLHHAANNGHMHILSFLVNFGANLFALDNEFHTAMDVAAARDRMDCVRFLDASASQQTTRDPRRVASLKKEAGKKAEKRVKLCEKVKKRHKSKMDKMYRGAGDDEAGAGVSNAGSMPNEQFSKLIAAKTSGSLSARVKGTLQGRFGKKDKGGTLTKEGGDENVVYGSQDNPEFMDVFNEQDENEEETEGGFGDEGDAEGDGDSLPAENKQSIFNRPGLGGLTFMKKLGLDSEDVASESNENLGYLVCNEIFETGDDDVGGAGDVPWEQEDLGLDDELDEETSPLDTFLSTISLQEFTMAFNREQLDLEALMLCSDNDLKGIRIQLGPRKKILEAATRRTNALANPGKMMDSFL